jgi:predicted transcriptional regulator
MPRVTSIRLSDDLAARLDELATALDRPRAWLIDQAIARYVDEEAWQVVAISEALADFQTGGAILNPHDEVMKRMEERIRLRTSDAGPLA